MNEKRAACWHQVLTRSNNSFNWIFFKVAILTFFAFTVFRFRQTAWTPKFLFSKLKVIALKKTIFDVVNVVVLGRFAVA